MALDEADLERVRAMWRDLCAAPSAFARPGIEVVDASEIRSAPPGAISIVVLRDAAVVSGPGVVAHRDRLVALGLPGLTDGASLEGVLGPFARTLGPADLWYGRTAIAPSHEIAGPVAGDHPLLAALLADASDDDVDESGITEMSSGVFVALAADGAAAAGCGWREWPHRVAHVGVLTAVSRRGCGFGTSAAAHAVAAASADGLLPQWRAARWNAASNGLAGRLGLTHVGTQFSVLPASG